MIDYFEETGFKEKQSYPITIYAHLVMWKKLESWSKESLPKFINDLYNGKQMIENWKNVRKLNVKIK